MNTLPKPVNPFDFDRLDNPPHEFTPVPMWFWNDELDAREIRRQIRDFHDHEVYGFILHPRMGLPRTIPYLSDVYLDDVAVAVEAAAELDMTVYLYDEGMYPSGSAHGMVVAENPAFAAQALVRRPCDGISIPLQPGDHLVCRTKPGHDGETVDYVQTRSGGTIRGIHFGEDDFEPGAPPAADLLNPDATACFIRLTHERYYARLSSHFGRTIAGFFTDEPSLTGRGPMDGKIPWTDGMLVRCKENGIGEEDLAALFTSEPGPGEKIRSRYEALCREILISNYYLPLSQWCEAHGIVLAGHPDQSDDIGLLRHFQLPGQDLVHRAVGPENGKALTGRDSTLAKCASGAALQDGRRRNSVECFGCCVRNQPGKGWDLPPEDMKWFIDWMAVRGVNLFFPHAFYYSLEGARKYERPPDVGPAQTWWGDYACWSRYMRRLSCLLTDIEGLAGIAVLCKGNQLPWKSVQMLYRHQLDFSYLEERCLASPETMIRDRFLALRNCRYHAILVENRADFGAGTQAVLDQCRQAGILVLEPDLDTPDGTWIDLLMDSSFARTEEPVPDLRLTGGIRGRTPFILLSNEGGHDLAFTLNGRLAGCPAVWDPWEGQWFRPRSKSTQPDRSSVDMNLMYRQSLVLFFLPEDTVLPPAGMHGNLRQEMPAGAGRMLDDLSSGWVLKFQDMEEPVSSGGLDDWQDIRKDGIYSGQAAYEKSFTLDPPPGGRIVLDCGEVYDVMKVHLNGRHLKTLFWRPYQVDLTDFLKKGRNDLRIEVMNSISCRMDQSWKPSGMLGPVQLLFAPEARMPS
jgi:hypothetical protein